MLQYLFLIGELKLPFFFRTIMWQYSSLNTASAIRCYYCCLMSFVPYLTSALPRHFELNVSLGNERSLLRVARTVAHLLCGLLEFIEVM